MTATARASDRRTYRPLRHFLSPYVRRLVHDHDVDVRSIRGSGRDGRVSKDDIVSHLRMRGAQPAAPPPPEPGSEAAGDRDRAYFGFVAVDVDLTLDRERTAEGSLAAVARAVGLVLRASRPNDVTSPGPRSLPDGWSEELTVLHPETGAPVVIRDHALLSGQGLSRSITEHRASDPATEETADALTLARTAHPSLVAQGGALPEGHAGALVLSAAARKPVVVATEAGEVLAVRTMARLTLSYDPERVGGEAAAWFVVAVGESLTARAASPD